MNILKYKLFLELKIYLKRFNESNDEYIDVEKNTITMS